MMINHVLPILADEIEPIEVPLYRLYLFEFLVGVSFAQ